jgi:hypothetical protein
LLFFALYGHLPKPSIGMPLYLAIFVDATDFDVKFLCCGRKKASVQSAYFQSTKTMTQAAEQAGFGGAGAAAVEPVYEAAPEVTGAAALLPAGNIADEQANGAASMPVVGPTAVVPVAAVAGPATANMAGPLVPLVGIQPMFDVEAGLLGPVPTKTNAASEIRAWIDEA